MREKSCNIKLRGSGLPHLQFILCHVFDIRLIEMGEPAVPAPEGKMPASDGKIMRTGYMTMPAFGSIHKFPEVIAPNLRVRTRLCYILYPRDIDPGCPTILACHLCLVRHRFNNLVCYLFAVIAISAILCEDKPVTHERYWMRRGSLICCYKNNAVNR
jgi:hypothetical protein